MQEVDVAGNKYITPDCLRSLISNGNISYIEFDEVANLDFRLIQAVDLFRSPGTQLAVNVRRVRQKDGLDSQVWVVGSMRDYKRYAEVGVSYVLMHDPKLIERIVSAKKG